MPENPVEGRDGREGLRDFSCEQIGDLVELGEVHGGGSIEEIEVHGGDRRALQRGTRIPDENRFNWTVAKASAISTRLGAASMN